MGRREVEGEGPSEDEVDAYTKSSDQARVILIGLPVSEFRRTVYEDCCIAIGSSYHTTNFDR